MPQCILLLPRPLLLTFNSLKHVPILHPALLICSPSLQDGSESHLIHAWRQVQVNLDVAPVQWPYASQRYLAPQTHDLFFKVFNRNPMLPTRASEFGFVTRI